LAVFYPHPEGGLSIWQVAGAVAVLGGISAAAWIGRRRFPFLLVGWLWYLGMLVPVIGFVQVGDQARADRYTYLPGIGLCIALAWGVSQLSLSAPQRRWLYATASTLAVVVLAALAWLQTSYWRNSERLWVRAVVCTTHNATAQYNLGVTLAERGDIGNAMKCFQATIAIQPRSADAENNLGVLLARSGKIDDAMKHFQAALRIKPDLVGARNNLQMSIQCQNQTRGAGPP
jgi:protein O-mannosyl-transferase